MTREPMSFIMTKTGVHQEQLLVGTNLDEGTSVVSGIGKDRKQASDMLFHFRWVDKLGVKAIGNDNSVCRTYPSKYSRSAVVKFVFDLRRAAINKRIGR